MAALTSTSASVDLLDAHESQGWASLPFEASEHLSNPERRMTWATSSQRVTTSTANHLVDEERFHHLNWEWAPLPFDADSLLSEVDHDATWPPSFTVEATAAQHSLSSVDDAQQFGGWASLPFNRVDPFGDDQPSLERGVPDFPLVPIEPALLANDERTATQTQLEEDSLLARILLQGEFEDAGLDPTGMEWALDFYSHMLMPSSGGSTADEARNKRKRASTESKQRDSLPPKNKQKETASSDSISSPVPARPPIDRTLCGICQERFTPREDDPEMTGEPSGSRKSGMSLACTEGHSYCHDCLRTFLKLKLADQELVGGAFPVRCPECAWEVDSRLVASLLSKEDSDSWQLQKLLHSKTKYYCPNPRCSELLDAPQDLSLTNTSCPKCRVNMCFRCRSPWHQGYTCEENKRPNFAINALLDALGWVRCPGCDVVVDRIEGCSHMTCRCGQHFCYACGHEYHGGCTRPGGCMRPRFDAAVDGGEEFGQMAFTWEKLETEEEKQDRLKARNIWRRMFGGLFRRRRREVIDLF